MICRCPEGALHKWGESTPIAPQADFWTQEENQPLLLRWVLFHSDMVRNAKECQSGACLSLACGRCIMSWFLEPSAGLLARDILILSDGMVISSWSALCMRVKNRCRRRSTNSLQTIFLRKVVTLTTPYCPQAQRAAYLWTCSRLLMSFLRVGSHTVAQRSSWDFTSTDKPSLCTYREHRIDSG